VGIVDAGVNDLAVPRARFRAEAVGGFEYQNVTPARSQRPRNRQSNDARADNNYVNAIHEVSLASLKFDVASIATARDAVFSSGMYTHPGMYSACCMSPMSTTANASAAGQITLGGDLTVNRLGFGAMRITGPGIWGPPADVSEAVRVVQRAVQLGVNFIDTADSYGPDVSESIIAQALYPYPADLVIATKGGLVRPGPDVWNRNGHPKHLREACEGSLRRLRRDRIDVYQLHSVDPGVPLSDSVGELVRLQTEGKIRHIGISNVTLDQLKQAERLTPIVSVQNRFNLEDRRADAVVEYCARKSIAFIPWAPLDSGRHARQAGSGGALARIAARHGVSVGGAAIAWLLQHSNVMLPIPGTGSVKHLEENVAAASIRLTPEEMRELGPGRG
jgi:pyridoxine 4-dehydrogenase